MLNHTFNQAMQNGQKIFNGSSFNGPVSNASSMQSLFESNSTNMFDTVSSTCTWSNSEMASIADNLLMKFGKIHELTQSLKVAEEKRNKYDLKVQKEIATLQVSKINKNTNLRKIKLCVSLSKQWHTDRVFFSVSIWMHWHLMIEITCVYTNTYSNKRVNQLHI